MIFKKISKTLSTFFSVDQINFPSSPRAVRTPFWRKFLRRRQNFQKTKEAFYRHFLDHIDQKKNASQKLVFIPPSKLVFIGAKGALEKF